MSDPTLLVLASLADGAKHGYAMMVDIQSFANIRLGPGTLYGAITRLEQRVLDEESNGEHVLAAGRLHRAAGEDQACGRIHAHAALSSYPREEGRRRSVP